MKKKIVAILSVIVMLTAVLICVGCDKPKYTNAEENEYKEVRVCGGGRKHPALMVLRTAGYDINDVTVEVYFGTGFGTATSDAEWNVEVTKNVYRDGYEYADMYLVNYTGNENDLVQHLRKGTISEDWYRIRRIEDYTSVEYYCPSGERTRESFHHHEFITIPKELLVGDSGEILFFLYGKPWSNWTTGTSMEQLAGIDLRYEIDNGKVTLTSPHE